MKYLYIILLLPLFTLYSQTKGTVLKYEVYYNFTTPLSREIDVYTTNDFCYSIEKPYGPWKLQGAPGLIVEANTADKKIHFLLNTVQFNKILPEIKLPNLKEIDLKEYVALLDENGNYEYYEDRNTKVSKKSNTRSVIEPIYEWEEQEQKKVNI